MKAALIRIPLTTLRDLLHLPKDCQLTKARQTWEHEKDGVFEILVEGPSLPEIPKCQCYPYGSIEFTIENGIIVSSKLQV